MKALKNNRVAWRNVIAFTIVPIVGFICGCGESIKTPFVRQDPKASFETFMKSYVGHLTMIMDEKEKKDQALVQEQIRKNAEIGPVVLTVEGVKNDSYNPSKERIPEDRRGVVIYRYVPGSERYDVRKTESVVAPYEGLLTIKYTDQYITTYDRSIGRSLFKAGDAGDIDEGTTTLKFGFREGKWEPMDITSKHGTTSVFDRKNGKWYWTAFERTRQ